MQEEANLQVSPLRKLQLDEYEILKSVIKVWEQNGIRYFLGYGTLLGAIRHQGFIPWDDDVDVFLPRPDFERFIQIADQVLEEPYFLNNESMSVNINLKHYRCIEDPSHKQTRKYGDRLSEYNTRIDIFPLDGAPKSAIGRWWLSFRAAMLKQLIRFPRAYAMGVMDKKRSAAESVIIWLNKTLGIGKLLSPEKMVRSLEKMRKRHPYDTSEYAYAWVPDYKWKKILCRREWFGEGVKARFEASAFTVPADSDAVLHQFYGDYMSPPPEALRTTKHSVCSEEA